MTTAAAQPTKAEPLVRSGLGALLMVASAAVASTLGLSVRLVDDASGWQIIFYRNLSMVLVVVAYLVLRHPRRFWAHFVSVGWTGIVGGISMAIASSFGVWAFLHTAIANVYFMGGTVPFFAGLLGWFILRERIRLVTWVSMAMAFIGIAIMTGGGLAQGRYFGDLLALCAMVCFACLVVAMRAGRLQDMTPLLAIGSSLAAIAAAFLVPTFAISLHDIAICIAMGAVQSFVAYILFMFATRHLRAGEASLLGISETIFGPLWVWLAVNEIPPGATFLGGAVILIAVVAQGIATLRLERAQGGD